MNNSVSKTVLLVEDDDGDAFLPARAFKLFDHEIDLVRVTGGQDAMMFMEGRGSFSDREFPKCMILDLEMPNGDGLWTLQRLAQQKGRRIPVIVMSGAADQIEKTRNFPFVVCAVEKPACEDDYKDLLAVVGRLVTAACASAA